MMVLRKAETSAPRVVPALPRAAVKTRSRGKRMTMRITSDATAVMTSPNFTGNHLLNNGNTCMFYCSVIMTCDGKDIYAKKPYIQIVRCA